MAETTRSRVRARRLALLLFAVTVLPAATLVWLGMRIVEQDRELLVQRTTARRDAMVQGVVGSLEQALVEATRHIVEGPVPEGMVRLAIGADEVRAEPVNGVAWLPGRESAVPAGDEPFRETERLEFGGAEIEALAAYRRALASSDAGLRAGSLVRIGRMHRRAGRLDEALQVYRDLAGLPATAIAGAPSDLHARREICDVLDRAQRREELTRAAAALEADLLAGRWQLDAPAWELTIDDLKRWLGRPVVVDDDRRAVSRAADYLWALPASQRSSEATTRRALSFGAMAVTVLQQRSPDGLTALVVTSPALSEWIRVATAGVPGTIATSIARAEDDPGTHQASADGTVVAVARAVETGLPWTLVVSMDEAAIAADAVAGRGGLLAVGLAAVLLIVGGGGYVLWRAMAREMAMARLQADFVSAVSHEFRTPLTSLRHVTELLEERDDLEPGRRAAFYEALGRNTRRLQRLVESLLDAARMRDGRKPYDLRPVDAGTLVSEVVSDFRSSADGPAVATDLAVTCGSDLTIRADRAAVTTALWNLLDNAVKYSPGRPVVHVVVRRHGPTVAIDVRDEGLGIRQEEQERIFDRFVRGAESGPRGIPGTGLGLSMVSHIIAAHGGTISVKSAEGKGSTFTIMLPSAG